MYACQDKPTVEITATGGCGYVNVSWTVIGNNDVCNIVSFTVELVSAPMNITERMQTDVNSYNFTGLPNDTVFNINVIGSSKLVNTDVASSSVRTKSMYVSMYLYMYVCTYVIVCYTHMIACMFQIAGYICTCICAYNVMCTYVRMYIYTYVIY